MTIQNAIDYFKNYIEFCKSDDVGSPTLEPYEIAIESMENDVPTKPIEKWRGEQENLPMFYKGTCPRCANEVSNLIAGIFRENITYCNHCGTKIDWSD